MMRLLRLKRRDRQVLNRLAKMIEPVKNKLEWMERDGLGQWHINWSDDGFYHQFLERLKLKFPDVPEGRLVHWMFDLVHLNLKDYLSHYGLIKLSEDRHPWLSLSLYQIMADDRFIPSHPWLLPISEVVDKNWKVYDLKTNRRYRLSVDISDDYIHLALYDL